MKKYIVLIISLYLNQLLFAGNYSASISYNHVTNNKYEFCLDIYRDTFYTVYPYLNYNIGSVMDTLFKVSEENIGDILHIKYKGTHNFLQAGAYFVNVSFPYRVSGVNNIPNSINTGMRIEAYININPFVGSNNSPNDSIPLIDSAIVNQAFSINISSNDIDGDSLSYKLKPCRGDDGLPINGYTYPAQPPVFTLDSITGILTWNTPQYQGGYSVLIQIEEWRSGSLISYTEREHFIVVNLGSGINNANDKSNGKVDVFPNPSNDIVNIRLKNSKEEIFEIEVFDIIGKQIFIKSNMRTSSSIINVNDYEPGIYFYRIISSNKEVYSGKIIVY
jgi:hypothetical protein